MAGPADLHCAESLTELHGEGLGCNLIGNELRTRKEVEQDIAEDEACNGVYLTVVVFRRICELAAHDLGRVEPEPAHDEGVKAFDAVVAGVAAQQSVSLFAQFLVVLAVFEFNDISSTLSVE